MQVVNLPETFVLSSPSSNSQGEFSRESRDRIAVLNSRKLIKGVKNAADYSTNRRAGGRLLDRP